MPRLFQLCHYIPALKSNGKLWDEEVPCAGHHPGCCLLSSSARPFPEWQQQSSQLSRDSNNITERNQTYREVSKRAAMSGYQWRWRICLCLDFPFFSNAFRWWGNWIVDQFSGGVNHPFALDFWGVLFCFLLFVCRITRKFLDVVQPAYHYWQFSNNWLPEEWVTSPMDRCEDSRNDQWLNSNMSILLLLRYWWQ